VGGDVARPAKLTDMAGPTTRDASDARSELRSRSKRLFGNADRLEVAVAVSRAPGGVVHAQGLSSELGISPPRVRAQLLAFVDSGVMTAVPRSELRQYYERLDDPFWAFIEKLVAAWARSAD
jgi:hypothetical protein